MSTKPARDNSFHIRYVIWLNESCMANTVRRGAKLTPPTLTDYNQITLDSWGAGPVLARLHHRDKHRDHVCVV